MWRGVAWRGMAHWCFVYFHFRMGFAAFACGLKYYEGLLLSPALRHYSSNTEQRKRVVPALCRSLSLSLFPRSICRYLSCLAVCLPFHSAGTTIIDMSYLAHDTKPCACISFHWISKSSKNTNILTSTINHQSSMSILFRDPHWNAIYIYINMDICICRCSKAQEKWE